MEVGNVINQGKNIVKGHVRELLGLDQDISQQRMKICLKCPLYKNNLGGQCNSALYLNPETGDVSNVKKDGYFKGCGCRLNAKTRLAGAHCPALKW